MRSPQRRTHCQETGIPRQSNATRAVIALSGAHIAKKTKFLGDQMQQDYAQPSAAYTLPRQRNAWAIECNKTMRSPQRCTHCQENEIPGQSNATRQCAALSSVHIAKTTKCLGYRMQQDNAQPSAVYTLPRKRNHWWMQKDNAQPSAAHTLPRKRNYWAICNKTMRSPQRRTHCQENVGNRTQQDNAQPSAAHTLWNVISNAHSYSQHPPTSPNTAPATQNESQDCSASHMKRYLQCAEQQSTPSNLTKYCACHAKWPPQIRQKFAENSWNAISNARPIREWSDHDPRMIRPWTRQSATRRATEVTFHTRQEQILLKITTFPAPAIIPNFTY